MVASTTNYEPPTTNQKSHAIARARPRIHSRPPSSTPRQNAGVGSSVQSLVSDDAAFDARRTAPVKPTPRFVDYRWSRRSQSAVGEYAAARRDRVRFFEWRPRLVSRCCSEWSDRAGNQTHGT